MTTYNMFGTMMEDIADVTTPKQMALYTLAVALLTLGLWGGTIIPYIGVVMLILTLNLLAVTVALAYWEIIGRKKQGLNRLIDSVQIQEGRK